MAIEKLEKNNGTCQLMNAVDNPIPFWATSHRDLGCPWATLPILDFRIPAINSYLQTHSTLYIQHVQSNNNLHDLGNN
jgi:hypothetical protein